ncbi:MAG: LemA family protein [Gammaproteobacteria bacterium]
MEILVIIGTLALLGLFFVVLYNRLVALRQARNNAFADIDVQLKQRFDLVPNLVNTVKGYATHESTVFEKITEARSSVGRAQQVNDRIAAEGALSSALTGLFAVAENYPDLKANQSFQQLQQELADIENKIAAARRYFNNATNEFNTSIQQFPANLFAAAFGFKNEPFFDLGADRAAQEKPVEVKF